MESRPQAVALIDEGQVLVSGSVADKPSRLVAPAEPVELLGRSRRFVGRGGEKLAAALDRFGIDVTGPPGPRRRRLHRRVHRLPAPGRRQRGGRGRRRARGQLHPRLPADPRVACHERLDIREVTLVTVGGTPVDLVTADLSFISVTRAVPVLAGEVVAPDSPLVILVKPQFEAGRAEASRGKGVIRDPAIHRRTLGEVAAALDSAGAVIMGAMPSPITGHSGNVEFLLHARTPRGPAATGTDGRRRTARPPPCSTRPSTRPT